MALRAAALNGNDDDDDDDTNGNGNDEEEAGEGGGGGKSARDAMKTKKKIARGAVKPSGGEKKRHKTKSSLLLSFGAQEEEEDNAEEEEKEKRRKKKKKKGFGANLDATADVQRAAVSTAEDAAALHGAGRGEYSAAGMRRLKENYGITLTGSFKPAAAGLSTQKQEQELEQVTLPTQEEVRAARMHRQQLRISASSSLHHERTNMERRSSDYIPLKSSLVRSHRERQEGDEKEEKEEEEEDAMWIRHQLSNAIGGTGGASINERSMPRGTQGSSTIQSASAAIQRLRERVAHAENEARASEREMRENASSMREAEKATEAFETSMEATATQVGFLQDFLDYVGTLAHCLQDKAYIVEELEAHVRALDATRRDDARAKRDADFEYEWVGADAAARAAMQCALMMTSSTTSVPSADDVRRTAHAAAESAQRALHRQVSSMNETDEFGRSVGLQKDAHLKRRAARRSVRLESSWALLSSSPVVGPCSSESEDSDEDVETFETGMREAALTASSIFSDVDDSFASLECVKERLETFKQKYPAAYADAFIALSAPAVFEVYVRLQMLTYLPSRCGASKAHIDDQEWFQTLFNYGRSAASDAEFDEDGDDAKVIPELVRKVVLPSFVRSICSDNGTTDDDDDRDNAEDAQSDRAHIGERDKKRRGTRLDWTRMREATSLAAVANELLIYLPRETAELRESFTRVASSLLEQIAHLKTPSWPPSVIDAYPLCREVVQICFRRALRLLQSALAWKDILGEALIQDAVTNRLLETKLVPIVAATAGFDTSLASTMLQRITSTVPAHYRDIQALRSLSDALPVSKG